MRSCARCARATRLTLAHSQRVQRCALALAREAGITDGPMLEAIDGAALLHDIGKLGIPDLVLQKPGPLTPDEYDQVKAHADHRRRHSDGRGLPGSAGAHRAPPPRELGWHRLSGPAARRGHSDRRARALDRRLLRRADLGSSLPPRAVARLGGRDDSRAPRDDVRLGRSPTRFCGSCRACDPDRRGTTRAGRRRGRTRSGSRRGRCEKASLGQPDVPRAARPGARVRRRRHRRGRGLSRRRGAAAAPAIIRGCSLMLLGLAVATSAAKIELPLGRSQSNLSLSHAVNFWALFALGPAPTALHRRGERVGAVHAARRRAQPAAPGRVQHRLADADRLGRRPAAGPDHGRGRARASRRWRAPPPSWRRSTSSSTPRWSPPRSRSRRASRSRAPGIATSCGARRAIWPARRWRPSRPRRGSGAGSAGSRCWRCRCTWSSAATTRSSRASARSRTKRSARWTCSWRRSRRSRWRSKPRRAARRSTSDRSSSTRRRWPKRSASPTRRCRRCARRRCCTTSATWPCPSTFSSKPDALTPEEFERVKIHPARRRRDSAQRAVRRAGRRARALPSRALGRPGLSGRAARRGHSARRAHPRDRGLLTARCRPIARTGPGAAPSRRSRCSATTRASRSIRSWSSSSSRGCASTAALPEDAVARARGAEHEQLALQDIAGTHREEQTLYEIAQALGSNLGVDDAMALINDKVSRLVPFTTCALFLGNDNDGLRLPIRARARHRGAVQVDAEVVERSLAPAPGVRRRPRRPRRRPEGAAALSADLRRAV